MCISAICVSAQVSALYLLSFTDLQLMFGEQQLEWERAVDAVQTRNIKKPPVTSLLLRTQKTFPLSFNRKRLQPYQTFAYSERNAIEKCAFVLQY